jgi:hypothetical protein
MNSSFLAERYKPTVSRSVVDEAANAVLAYCVAATFLLKNKGMVLTPEHYCLLLDYMERGETSVDFRSEEDDNETIDVISLRAPISMEARQYVLTKLRDKMSPEFSMVKSIINFLNNNHGFTKLVSQLTNNGITNYIVVDIDCLSVDKPMSTSILVDNEWIRIFNSFLPIYGYKGSLGGIGQKELQKDYGFSAQRNFLLACLGIDIGEDSSLYYETAHNNGASTDKTLELATRNLYNDVCRKINQGLSGALDSALSDYKQNLIQSMLKCAYGVDISFHGYCLLLPSEGVAHDSFDVQQLFKKLYDAKLHTMCPANLNPSIRIVDGDNKELFKVRFKKESYSPNVTGYRYKVYFIPTNIRNLSTKKETYE